MAANDLGSRAVGYPIDSELTLRQRAEQQAMAQGMYSQAELTSEQTARLSHELRVCQIALDLQQDELRQTQAALEAAQERYFDMYDLAPVGYLSINPAGSILEANLTSATLLNLARSALIRQPLVGFILPEDQGIFQSSRQRLFGTGGRQRCELRLLRPDRPPLWVGLEMTLAQDTDNGAAIGRVVLSDITERKQVEDQLHQSSQLIAALLDQPTDLAVVASLDGTIQVVNEPLAQSLGKPANQLIGQNLWDQFPPQMTEIRRPNFEQVVRTGQALRVEDIGLFGIYDTTITPVLDDNGQVQSVAVLGRNITERKEVENQLRQSEALLQAIINNAPIFVGIIDKNGIVQFLDGRALNSIMPDSARRKIVGQHMTQIFRPHIAQPRLERALAGEEFAVKDYFDNGQVFEIRLAPMPGAGGKPVGMIGVGFDITEQQRAQAEIDRSRQQLQAVLDNVADGITVIDPQYKLLFANQAAARMAYFATVDEYMAAKNIVANFEMTDEDGASFMLEQIPGPRSLSGQEYPPVIIRYRPRHGGEDHWAQVRDRPVFDEQGHVQMVVAISHDITEMKQSQQRLEAALRQEHSFVDRVIDTAQVILLVTDIDGRITLINHFLEEMSGYCLEEVRGKDWIDTFLPVWDRERMRSRLQQALSELRVHGNINPILTKSGEERQIEWFTSFLRDDQDTVIGVLAIGHDITQRLEADRQIKLHAHRAEALARLAARVNAQLDLQAVLDIVACEVVQAAHYPICNVMIFDESTDSLHVAAAAGEFIEDSFKLQPVPKPLYLELLKSKQDYILIPDVGLLPPDLYRQKDFKANARTIVNLPILRNNLLIGCLNAFSVNEVRLPSEDELDLLQALADQASTAIANARLFKEVSDARQRLKTLSQRLVEIQEDDRRMLARELHDEFGQTLTSQILSLDMALASLDHLSEPAKKACAIVENTRQQTQSLLDQLREICLQLRPAQLDDLGLLPAMQATFNRFTQKTNIAVHFKHAGLDGRYPAQVETAIYRIIQEALTNVARYAEVDEVSVILWSDGHTLRLQVEDDGAGFDLAEATARTNSSGISGMLERAAACGGYLEIDTEPGAGACLTAEFPLASEFETI